VALQDQQAERLVAAEDDGRKQAERRLRDEDLGVDVEPFALA